MLAAMQPDTGGRFTVRLLGHDEQQAHFQLELATADGTWSTRASVTAAQGEVRWDAWATTGEPPDWLCQYTRAALRTAWRQHGEHGWPRRLTRWRDKPSARSREGSLDD